MQLERLYVTVLPDMSKFGPQLSGGAQRAGTKAGHSGGIGFKKAFTAGVGAILGAEIFNKAAQGVTNFFHGAIAESEQALKSTAQTNAVIRSTKGAANVSASAVDNLANSLSRKRGVDDEVIASGENMLLTFTRVRNEAGKGNDIFTQATKISGDLAAATGKDLVGANVMLGKALNDPTRGLTALTRVGVTFDNGQRKQIKAMQKAGDVAGAQKIILAELRKEFGGSAEAQATLTDKMKVGWANVKESVGVGLQKSFKALSPVFSSVGRIATGVFSSLDHSLGGTKGVFQSFADFLQTHQAAITHGFVVGAQATLGFLEGMLRMAAGGIRAYVALNTGLNKFFSNNLNFIGKFIAGAAKAWGWIPGIGPKLKAASADFNSWSAGAQAGFKDQGKGALAAADKLDEYAGAAHKAGVKVGELGKAEVASAKQRDAAAKAAIAIGDIGKAGDASKRKLHHFNVESLSGTTTQLKFAAKVHAARAAMVEQWKTGQKAGDTQAELTKRWGKGKDALHREFIQMGFSKKEADRLTAAYGKVPKHVEVKHSTPGGVAARHTLQGVASDAHNIHGKKVVVEVSINSTLNKLNQDIVKKYGLGGRKIGQAAGGVLPGYTPGRDVHRFFSATGGELDLSGGEAVMRPEWTRAVGGAPAVAKMNSDAKAGRMAGGGVISRDIIAQIRAHGNTYNYGAIRDAAAQAVGGADRAMAERQGAKAIADATKKALAAGRAAQSAASGGGGGPVGGAAYVRALNYVKRHAGHPYVYATIWDCSGLIGAAQSVAYGQAPHRRYATPAFHGAHAQGFTRNKRSPFMVGVNPSPGKSGHMAGTINGVNVESAGGVGVRYGHSARGWNNSMFSWRGGLAHGGVVKLPRNGRDGDLPFDLLDPRGQHYSRGLADLVHAAGYDRGGVLPPGLTLAYNGTGKNEHIPDPTTSKGRPIMITIDLGDGLRQQVRGMLDEHDEFKASVRRTH